MPNLIFLGESHEDPAVFLLLIQALPQLKQQGYKIFLEHPPARPMQILNSCLYSLKILALFPKGVPEKLHYFDQEQKLFYNSIREPDYYDTDDKEIAALSNQYKQSFSRKHWLEARKKFIRRAIQQAINIIAIDVEYPENFEGENLRQRREYMLNQISQQLNHDENAIVISGLSHLLNTFELGYVQQGFETLCASHSNEAITHKNRKFFFFYSDRNSMAFKEAISRIEQHKKTQADSQICQIFRPIDSDYSVNKVISNILSNNPGKLDELIISYQLEDASPTSLEQGLRTAANSGHFTRLKLLLDFNTNVNAQADKNGKTALHSAVVNSKAAPQSKLTCVKLLLDSKADVSIQDNLDQTPLDQPNCIEGVETLFNSTHNHT